MHNGRGRRKNGSVKAPKNRQRPTMSHLISEQSLPTRSKSSVASDDSVDTSDDTSAAPSFSSSPPSTKSITNGVHRPAMARKASSPMAPAFMVSAPGKVIVFGEHAVVHGKAAMAAAISLRSYLLVTTLTKSQRTITLNFRDIGLNHTWSIDELPWDLFHQLTKKIGRAHV